jgi:hypothetical protein
MAPVMMENTPIPVSISTIAMTRPAVVVTSTLLPSVVTVPERPPDPVPCRDVMAYVALNAGEDGATTYDQKHCQGNDELQSVKGQQLRDQLGAASDAN